jgi:hypothetical protein
VLGRHSQTWGRVEPPSAERPIRRPVGCTARSHRLRRRSPARTRDRSTGVCRRRSGGCTRLESALGDREDLARGCLSDEPALGTPSSEHRRDQVRRQPATAGAVELHGDAVEPADGGGPPAPGTGLPGHVLTHRTHLPAASAGARNGSRPGFCYQVRPGLVPGRSRDPPGRHRLPRWHARPLRLLRGPHQSRVPAPSGEHVLEPTRHDGVHPETCRCRRDARWRTIGGRGRQPAPGR